MVSELWWVVNWKIVGQMGQEECWVNGGGWWTERQWDRWDKRNDEWMVVGGELKDSGTCDKRNSEWMVVGGELNKSWTDGTKEISSEWWWVVSWKSVGQMGQEELWVNGGGWWTLKRVRQMGQVKCWVNGGGWWTERQWDRWVKRNDEWMVVGGELKDSGTDGTREMVSEWWWEVNWIRVRQMGQKKFWVNGGG